MFLIFFCEASGDIGFIMFYLLNVIEHGTTVHTAYHGRLLQLRSLEPIHPLPGISGHSGIVIAQINGRVNQNWYGE